MGMTINAHKTKVIIINSQKITYANSMYDKNNLEEVTSYKYLGIDIHHKLGGSDFIQISWNRYSSQT